MLSDHDRGSYWVKAILGVQAKEIHLITAPHALSLIKKILSFHGFGFEIVQHERNTPLLWEEKSCRFPTDIKNADALIVFSKRKVLNIAAILLKKGFTVSVLYGSMPPETRRKQMEQFRKGFSKILVSTDAIGMGLNLPIKRILFMENEKFDGKNVRLLKPEEVQQIAGRAGREGIYEKGLVNATKGSKSLKKSLKAIVQDIEFSYLPISQDSIKMFPYESFELLKRTWEFYQIEIKDSPYKVHPLNEVEAKMAYLERKLNNLDIELPLSKKVSLCSVPFSIDEQHMTQCWLEMIKEYLLGNELKYPHVYTDSSDVEKLENSYKKLSLYTSFLYSQSIDFDEDKVIDLKEEISKKIFQVLSKNLTTFIKKCTQCGKQLAWDFPHRNCEKCHRNRYYFEDYY
nr:helicase-related protein [Bacillus sp. 03113]